MTTFSPEYRLTLFSPRSVDANEATILIPSSGNIHGDYFRVTTESVADNILPRPGFEVDTLGVIVISSTCVKDATNVFEGAFSLKCTTTNAISGFSFRDKDGNRFPCKPGEQWSFSIYMYGTGGAIGKTIRHAIEFRDITGTGSTGLASVDYSLASGWNRISISGIAPVGTVSATPVVVTPSAQGVFDFWADNQQLEKGSVSQYTSYRPYLSFPRGRTGRIDVLSRTTDVGSMTFEVIDKAAVPGTNANRWVSAFLGNTSGDPQLGGLKCVVEERLNPTDSWTAYFTGHTKSVSLSGRRVYNIVVRDMTYELTKLSLFNQPPHSGITYVGRPSLLPLGFTGISYGPITPVAELSGTIVSPVSLGGANMTGVAKVTIAAASIARKENFVTSNLIAAVAPNTYRAGGPGLAESWLPNFSGTARAHLTWNGGANQGDFLVGRLGLTPYRAGGGAYGHSSVFEFYIKALQSTTDLGYSANPSNGTTVTFRIFADHKIEKGAALLVEVDNPLTMLGDILDGQFGPLWRSPETLPPGKVFGDPHRVFSHTVDATDQPALAPLRLVIEKAADNALEWIQKQLLKPYGMALICDGAGVFSVVDLRLPSAVPGTTITDADVILGEAPSWEFDRDQAIYRAESTLWEDLQPKYDDIKNMPEKYPAMQNLLLSSIDHPKIQLGIGSADFGDKVWKMEGEGYRVMEGDTTINGTDRVSYLEGKIKEQQDAMRRPFSHGATYITLPCRRTATIASLIQGQAVQVNVSSLPNANTGKRGGARVMRVVEKTSDVLRTNIRLLDLGLALAVSTPPTLGSPAHGTDTRHDANINVTLFGVFPAEIQYAMTSGGSAPIEASPAWRTWDQSPLRVSSNIGFTGLTPGGRLWVRARSLPLEANVLQLPSAWTVSTSLDMTSYGAPSALVFSSITAHSAIASWTNGASDLNVLIGLRSPDSGAYTRVATLPGGSTQYQFQNLVASTTYGVQITYFSNHGIFSGSVSGSFVTTATELKPPRPPIIRRWNFPVF